MKIAYVINSLEGGGAASPVPDLTRVMKEYGADVRVFALTRRNGKALPAMEVAGLNVACRNGGESDHFAAARWLDHQVRDWGASHLWTSLTRATLLGQLVGMRRHLPVVSWQHNAYLKPWNLRLLRVMQKRSALWVGDSRLVTDMTAERLSIAQDRLFLWQIFRADSAAPLARPWQAGEVLRIGSLGRLHRAKGYDVLIAALALLRQRGFVPDTPFHIEIAGEGTLLGELTAQAHAAGVSDWISFPGFAENPRQWLSTLHLYCQPSRREGLCIAVHEAMQAGLPVIASRVGEMPYSIEDPGCGRLVDAENPQQLAAALEAMLIRPAELASIGQRARLRVLDRFSDQKFTQAGRTILDRLAALTPQA